MLLRPASEPEECPATSLVAMQRWGTMSASRFPDGVSGRLPPPFVWSAREGAADVELSGRVPEWLHGQLVRTCPAVFELPRWRAGHWFDGLSLLYGFRFERGKVTFAQKLLASQALDNALAGRRDRSQFGTPMQRGFFQRLFQPKPKTTDNANVNVIPWQGQFLAITETLHEHVIDEATLESRGVRPLDRALGKLASTTAHPHFDRARGAMVNLGSHYGPRSEVVVFREDAQSGAVTIEGRLPRKRMPYVHSFGMSERAVVVVEHPLTVNPVSLLWSDRPFIDHFAWRPQDGTRFWKLDRRTGQWTSYETEAFFTFHVVNQFEEGDDVVIDFIAYDDVAWIERLRTSELGATLPSFDTPLRRARLTPGRKTVTPERISGAFFEFPAINYGRSAGKPYAFAWGADLRSDLDVFTSTTLKVELATGVVTAFAEPKWALGEPVFVAAPNATSEEDGVLLSVGTHRDGGRSALFVLSAQSLEPLGRAEVAVDIPLGFHGSFARAASERV